MYRRSLLIVIILVAFFSWFAISYIQVMKHNMERRGIGYLSDWNVCKLMIDANAKQTLSD